MMTRAATGDRMAWRLHREVVLLAGWGRAILLQLAHPLIARGVADHSTFAGGPWGRVKRLHRTLSAMLVLTYERFVAPLTPDERDRYCVEAGADAWLLGIPPERLPGSAAELAAYMG